jgi:hypothetical protein
MKIAATTKFGEAADAMRLNGKKASSDTKALLVLAG